MARLAVILSGVIILGAITIGLGLALAGLIDGSARGALVIVPALLLITLLVRVAFGPRGR